MRKYTRKYPDQFFKVWIISAAARFVSAMAAPEQPLTTPGVPPLTLDQGSWVCRPESVSLFFAVFVHFSLFMLISMIERTKFCVMAWVWLYN